MLRPIAALAWLTPAGLMCLLPDAALADPATPASGRPRELSRALVSLDHPETPAQTHDEEPVLAAATSEHPSALSLIPLENRADLFELVAAHTPGADRDEDTGAVTLYGAARGRTAFYLDGVRLWRLRLPTAMLARVGIEPAGYGAEYADAAAGLVVLRARKGTNRFQLEYETFADRHHGTSLTTSLGLAGPVVRDRLFVAAGVEGDLENGLGMQDPTGFFPDTPHPASRGLAAAVNATFVPTDGQEVELLGLLKRDSLENFHGLGVAPESQPRIQDRGYLLTGQWRGRLWEGATSGLQGSFSSNTQRLDSMLCWQDPQMCDAESPVVQTFPRRQVFDNGLERERDTHRTWQLGARVAQALGAGAGASGRGQLRAFARVHGMGIENGRSIPSGSYTQYNGVIPDRRVTQLADGAGSVDSLEILAGVEAEVRVGGGLWVVPGLAWVGARTESGVGSTWSATSLAPRLGLAWDATGDGRTWLRASAGQRADPDLFRLQREILGRPAQRTCRWDPDAGTFTRNCTVDGNRTVTLGLPCGPTGLSDLGRPCRGQAAVSDTLELTASARRLVTPLLELGMDVVYRDGEALAPLETNRVWTQVGGGIEPTGNFRNGRAETVNDLSTNLEAKTLGLSPGLRLRGEHVDLGASYTWSRRRPVGTSRPGQRWWLPENRHHLHLLGNFSPAPYLALGLAYRYASGAPFARPYYNEVTGVFGDYRSGIGSNGGGNVNGPSVDDLPRHPSAQRLSLHVRVRGRALIGADIDFFADLLNVLFAEGPVRTDETGRDFSTAPPYVPLVSDGYETMTTGHRFVRLGVRYRY